MTTMLSRRSFIHLGALASAGALGCFLLPGCAQPHIKQDSTESDTTLVTKGEDGLCAIEFFAFDTICSIQAYAEPDLLRELKERCEFFDSIFSRTREDSDISNINAAQGAQVQVYPETADLIEKSLAYCEASGGLFDITIGAATSLWDFDAGVVPNAEELAEATTHIDWHNVVVEGDMVMLADPAAKLDLGGIAKGYIADDLAGRLREAGCTGAFINLGGNVYALGVKATGNPWIAGLQDPNYSRESNSAEGAKLIGKVGITDRSLVSSGLYERNFTAEDGTLYYHILDPATGWPAQTDVIASVIESDRGIDGDAYSTILFLQGAQGALDTLENTEGFEGLIVNAADEIAASSGFVWGPVDEQ